MYLLKSLILGLLISLFALTGVSMPTVQAQTVGKSDSVQLTADRDRHHRHSYRYYPRYYNYGYPSYYYRQPYYYYYGSPYYYYSSPYYYYDSTPGLYFRFGF